VHVLIGGQLEVSYARDRHGRLVATRDAEPRPAPRLHLGRSAEGNVWALRADVEAPCAEEIARACAGEAPLRLAAPHRPPTCRERVVALLAPVERELRGPAYVLPRDLPRDGRARLATFEEASEWSEAFPWLANDFSSIQPVAVAFDHGRPASICHSPRGWTQAATEAGVETLEPFRNRGLATAAVACWALAVQATGRLAFYSTSWDNHASQAVARRLSAHLYGEDWHVP
jgi:hypothetical protein